MAEGGGALRELIAHFGIEVEHDALDKFEERIGEVKNKVMEAGKAILEALAFHEVKEFFEGQIEMAARLDDTAQRLGLTTDALQKFQFAAKLGGVEAEEASHSLGLFMRQLGEADEGGSEAAKTLHKLGVEFKDGHGKIRDSLEIVGDVADKMQNLDPTQRAAYAMKLFGRAGLAMVPVLKEGKKGLEELYDEFDELGGGMGKDFVEQAKKTDDEIQKMKFGWQSFKSQLVMAALPTINKIVDAMKDWTKTIVHIVKNTHALQHAFDFLKVGGIVAILYQIGKALLTIDLEEAFAAAPVILIIAAVVALYLAFDDLATMIEGGKSVLGDFLDEFGPVGAREQAIKALKDAIDNTTTAIGQAWDAVKELAKSLNIDLNAQGIFQTLAREAVEFFQIIESGTKNLKALVDAFARISSGDFKGAVDAMKGSTVGQEVQHGFSSPVQKMVDAAMDPSGQAALANMRDVGATQTTAAVRRRDVNFDKENGVGTREVHVQTGPLTVQVQAPSDSDPQAFGQAVGQGATKEIDKTLTKALIANKKL